jgi:hypothetical protein
MGVFLLIMLVLCKSLLPAMTGEGSGDLASAMHKTAAITQTHVTEMFYFAALVQSAGMGAVTGVFEEGNVISGVKHMFIMILVTWIVFKLIVTGV